MKSTENYTLALSRKAKKDLDHLPDKHAKRVLSALHHLRDNPFSGKKLSGKFAQLYSYRVWPYRIIYQIIRNKLFVIIIRIGHRKSVYR